MASSSGNYSIRSDMLPNSTSDDYRERRMKANREAARRSRMRKQEYFHHLIADISRYQKENGQIRAMISLVTQAYSNLMNENAVLRSQLTQLQHRLHSLNELIASTNAVYFDQPATLQFLANCTSNELIVDDYLGNSNTFNYPYLSQPTITVPPFNNGLFML